MNLEAHAILFVGDAEVDLQFVVPPHSDGFDELC
jgi:hypothetical protein